MYRHINTVDFFCKFNKYFAKRVINTASFFITNWYRRFHIEKAYLSLSKMFFLVLFNKKMIEKNIDFIKKTTWLKKQRFFQHIAFLNYFLDTLIITTYLIKDQFYRYHHASAIKRFVEAPHTIFFDDSLD